MKQAYLTAIFSKLHIPHDTKVVYMASFAGYWVAETVCHHIHGKRPVHVTAKMGIVAAMMRVHLKRLEDRIDTHGRVILQKQIPLPKKEKDVEIPTEVRAWHTFRRFDSEK